MPGNGPQIVGPLMEMISIFLKFRSRNLYLPAMREFLLLSILSFLFYSDEFSQRNYINA